MDNDKIVNFFFEIATLRRLLRTHKQVIPEVSDNISDHSFRVAIIGMILAEIEKADVNKVLRMCLFHDIAEARTGDANFINKQYVRLREEEARKDQMAGLPVGDVIIELLKEYEAHLSKESIVAKDADTLDQMVLEQEYFYKDEKNRNIWQNHAEENLKTESAKVLAKKIRNSNPLDWFYEMVKHKTGKDIR